MRYAVALARGTGRFEMLSPSALTCLVFFWRENTLWGSVVVVREGREGEGYLKGGAATFIHYPSSRFLKGHGVFEAPPKSFCQMA